MILSAAVSPSKTVIEEAYDVGVLDAYLDYVSVMAYDYHGHWDNKTGHVAPMYHHEDTDQNNNFNMVKIILLSIMYFVIITLFRILLCNTGFLKV